MRHRNPYRINDETNLFEVTANSSHPELVDSTRVWHFKGHTFKTETALDKFFRSNGLNPKRYWFRTSVEADGYKGKKLIRIFIVERVPPEERNQVLNYEDLYGKNRQGA